MMRRILITGCGGTASANFVRSLREAPEDFYLIGTDCNRYSLQRAETDERHLVPDCGRKEYLDVLEDLCVETGAELIFVQPDVELEFLSEVRDELPLRYFWPSKPVVHVCMNKYESHGRWRSAGLPQPATMLIHEEKDLRKAFLDFGPKIWLRETKGAFGKGSFPAESLEQAKAWLGFSQGWGRFTAAACLSAQSVTWQSIWKDGELFVAQSRLRLYWEFANRSPSGVTGLTGAGVTVSDPTVDEMAQRAILAIDPSPHGIFSVDLTYDQQGIPNPTEINIGRFFTTHFFFTKAGLNMPYIFVKLAFGEPSPEPARRINPLPSGLIWIRGMDVEPILTDLTTVDSFQKALERRLSRVCK